MSLTPADVSRLLPLPQVLHRRAVVHSVLNILQEPVPTFARNQTFERWNEGFSLYTSANGSADEWSLTSTPQGSVIRVFSHESPVSPFARRPTSMWPGLLDGIPKTLLPYALDVRFDADFFGYSGVPRATTFFWRSTHDSTWSHSPSVFPDASNLMLDMVLELSGPDQTLARWEEYADSEDLPELEDIAAIFTAAELTPELMSAFSSGSYDAVMAQVVSTGYRKHSNLFDFSMYEALGLSTQDLIDHPRFQGPHAIL